MRILAATLLFTAAIQAAPKVAVGEPAPDFAVTTLDGSRISISQLRGKRVLVFMWASW